MHDLLLLELNLLDASIIGLRFDQRVDLNGFWWLIGSRQEQNRPLKEKMEG